MYLLFSLRPLVTLLPLIALVNVNFYIFAFKINHPKGKSFIYSLSNDDYGKRIATNSATNGEESTRLATESSPGFHSRHSSNQEEDDDGSDSDGYSLHDDVDPGSSYNPQVFTQMSMYRSKAFRGSKNKPVPGSQYPSMMPQIAKVILESQSAHATPRPTAAGQSAHKAPARSRSLSSAPQQPQYFQYVHFGPTATTPQSVTEAPAKEYLRRPFYEDITTKPRLKSGKYARYETNIESPPAPGLATSFQKVVMYSPSSKPVETSSAMPDVFVHNVPPPNTPPSSSFSESDNFDHDDHFDQFDVTEPSQRLPPPLRAESHFDSPPKKFNPANSVIASPNSYMTLSYEPLRENKKTGTRQPRPPLSYQQQTKLQSFQQSEPKTEHDYSPPSSKVVFRTQTQHPMPHVSSIEDQQESPKHLVKLNYADTYGRPGLHEPPVVSTKQHNSHRQHQSRQYYNPNQANQANHQPISSFSQPAPEWQQQQAQAEPSQPDTSPKVTNYQSYQQRQREAQPQAADTDFQSYHYSPEGDRHHLSYLSTPEQAQASEVEQKYDFSESAQKYAKEFGFEMPSASGQSDASAASKASRLPLSTFESGNSKARLLSSAPSDDPVFSHQSSKNESHFYFNMIFPEFAPEFKEYQQPDRDASHMYQAMLSSTGDHRGHHSPKSALEENRFALSESSPKSKTEHNKVLSSMISFAKDLLADDAATGENGNRSAKKSSKENATNADDITKEEVDEILQKYNEVISNKQKTAAVVEAKDGAERADAQ